MESCQINKKKEGWDQTRRAQEIDQAATNKAEDKKLSALILRSKKNTLLISLTRYPKRSPLLKRTSSKRVLVRFLSQGSGVAAKGAAAKLMSQGPTETSLRGTSRIQLLRKSLMKKAFKTRRQILLKKIASQMKWSLLGVMTSGTRLTQLLKIASSKRSTTTITLHRTMPVRVYKLATNLGLECTRRLAKSQSLSLWMNSKRSNLLTSSSWPRNKATTTLSEITWLEVWCRRWRSTKKPRWVRL